MSLSELGEQQAGLDLDSERGFDAEFSKLIERVNEIKLNSDTSQSLAFAYIESLLKRAMAQPESVRAQLSKKIQVKLDDLDLSKPERRAVDSSNSSALKGLLSALNQQDNQEGIFSELDEQAQWDELSDSDFDKRQVNFEQMLRRQELAILKQSQKLNKHEEQAAPAAFAQLRSSKRFKAIQGQYQLEQLVHLSKEESPENPGPLNPQMLAIKAITLMHEISPAYLKRQVAQLETLFWLQQSKD